MADFPDICASDYNFTLKYNTQNYQSPLTKSTQTGSLTGDEWRGVSTYTNKYGAEAKTLKAFVLGLKGQVGRFNYTPPDLDQTGDAVAVATVNGVGQLGDSLNIQSADLSTTIYRVGDYITVNGELKSVITDCLTDGAGLGVVNFVPPLRQAPADLSPIEFEKPYMIAKLEDDEQASFQVSSPVIYNATFSIVEVF